MPSKYCPKCKRIVSSNHIPNYCPWGCGSLFEQPLIPANTDLIAYQKAMQEGKTPIIQEQLKLF